MNRPFAVHAETYLCVCILFTVSVAACALDIKTTTKPAQITNVRVGAVSIVIPSPNYLVEPGPDYRVIFETFAPVNNRLVAAFVPQDGIEPLHKGTTPPLDKYALIEVARQAEFAETNSAAFQQIAEVVTKQFGENLSQATSKGQEEANHNLKGMGSSATVTIDKPTPLGILFSMTNAIGAGTITPYTVNGVTTRRAMCIIFLHVNSRVLSLFVYATYKDEGTVTWVKTTSEQWASAILKANE
jgi:hypothetical protein